MHIACPLFAYSACATCSVCNYYEECMPMNKCIIIGATQLNSSSGYEFPQRERGAGIGVPCQSDMNVYGLLPVYPGLDPQSVQPGKSLFKHLLMSLLIGSHKVHVQYANRHMKCLYCYMF